MSEVEEFDVTCNTCIVSALAATGRRHGAMRKREVEIDKRGDFPIIALDPGGTTGWCVMVVGRDAMLDADVKILDNIALYTWGEFTGEENEQADCIEDMLDMWPGAAIVREDFILRTANKDRHVLSPVRLGACVDYFAYKRGRTVWLQQPSMAKSTATDERLKSWGLYRPGSDHARDATRHAITFARRAKSSVKVMGLAWPSLSRVDA